MAGPVADAATPRFSPGCPDAGSAVASTTAPGGAAVTDRADGAPGACPTAAATASSPRPVPRRRTAPLAVPVPNSAAPAGTAAGPGGKPLLLCGMPTMAAIRLRPSQRSAYRSASGPRRVLRRRVSSSFPSRRPRRRRRAPAPGRGRFRCRDVGRGTRLMSAGQAGPTGSARRFPCRDPSARNSPDAPALGKPSVASRAGEHSFRRRLSSGQRCGRCFCDGGPRCVGR